MSVHGQTLQGVFSHSEDQVRRDPKADLIPTP